MHESPLASVHIKRHLSKRELATIAVGLELLARSKENATLRDARLAAVLDEVLLPDAEILALALELTTARKVKVCRSKEKPA